MRRSAFCASCVIVSASSRMMSLNGGHGWPLATSGAGRDQTQRPRVPDRGARAHTRTSRWREPTARCANDLTFSRTTLMPRSSDAFISRFAPCEAGACVRRHRARARRARALSHLYSGPYSCCASARIVEVLPVPAHRVRVSPITRAAARRAESHTGRSVEEQVRKHALINGRHEHAHGLLLRRHVVDAARAEPA